MKKCNCFKIATLLLLLLCSIQTFAQYESEDDPNDPANFKRERGIHVGAFMGGYIPNKYTANNYNGYGFDLQGNKNDFANSWMYQKIHNQYGGGYGSQPDLIATALGVEANPKEWNFAESDMPNHMKYQFGFLLGINTQYLLNKNNGIMLNVNFVKLNVTGSFTMQRKKKNSPPPSYDSLLTFGIVGGEQRLFIQLGYQRMITNNQKTNLFVEGGLNINSTQFQKNEIEINSLTIDLVTNFNQIAYPTTTYFIRKPSKIGLGAFAGLGLDLVIGKRVISQIVYQPTYDKINIGFDPKLKLQHAAGLRVYYRL